MLYIFRLTWYHTYMKQIKAIRLIWICCLVVIIVFLLWRAIVPSGSITYSTDFGSYNYFISELSPQDRLQVSTGDVYNKILAEPVYFYLKTPRPFQSAEISFAYEDASPLLELGICRDKKSWNFQRLPIYFEKLEELALSDKTIFENGVLLWQKEKKYSSLEDFIKNPPSLENIGVYNYNYSPTIVLPFYQPLSEMTEFNLGARGNYTLSTYSNGQPIEIIFKVTQKDINISPSQITVTVYDRENNIIQTFQTTSLEPEIKLITPPLVSGAYRIEFKADNNIETESLITMQRKLSFINYVWLADLSRNNFSVFTDVTNISAQTINPKKLQSLKVNNQILEILETYNQFSLSLNDQTRKIKEIKIEKDDIILAGDGVFALSQDALFNPLPRQFSNKINLSESNLDYIIAGYEPIGLQKTGQRTVNFDLNQACLDNGRYPFIISAPQIDRNNPVTISKISINVTGKTLFNFIKSIWKRI